MTTHDLSTEIDRDVLMHSDDLDPVLTLAFIKSNLNVSHTTFYREVRPKLTIVQLSPRRLGVRRSDYEKFKASLVRVPGKAA